MGNSAQLNPTVLGSDEGHVQVESWRCGRHSFHELDFTANICGEHYETLDHWSGCQRSSCKGPRERPDCGGDGQKVDPSDLRGFPGRGAWFRSSREQTCFLWCHRGFPAKAHRRKLGAI